jgi:hypothetical protein
MSCTKIADEIGLQLSDPALQCEMRNLLLLLKLTESLVLDIDKHGILGQVATKYEEFQYKIY